MSGKLDILKRSSTGVQENLLLAELERNNYSKISQIKGIEKTKIVNDNDNEGIITTISLKTKSPTDEFSYLLSMPIQSLTEEKAVALTKAAELADHNLKELQARSIEDLWSSDLDKLGNESAKVLLEMKKSS